MGSLRLTRTALALKELDRKLPEIDRQGGAAMTDKEVAAWVRARQVAEDEVRKAFYFDTRDRNTQENCMLTSIGHLREWVAEEKGHG